MKRSSTANLDDAVSEAIATLRACEWRGSSHPLDDPDRGERLREVMARSPWWRDAAVRQGDWFLRWFASDAPDPTSESASGLARATVHRAALDDAIDASNEGRDKPPELADVESVLRRHRERSMLAILWQELLAAVPVEQTLAGLTALADASIVVAADTAHRLTAERYGEPRSDTEAGNPADVADTADASSSNHPGRLLVIGMGKLGGGELNVSSDIDLVYLYPDGGATVGGPRSIDNHDFYQRVARRLTKLLGARTAEGFVFRVDTRLRPFGESGPLAMSLDGFEHYLLTQGRTWERYAMVKARAITGHATDVARFESLRRPFVFRRYLDYSAIEALRELKRKIADSVRRRQLVDDIKLGTGGIREVEFLVQVRQLVRGGQTPTLQTRGLLDTLAVLVELEQLDGDEARLLGDDYRLLRRTENLIQALHDRQAHALPTDAEDRQRIARICGHADWSDFRKRLDAARMRVAARFDRLFDEDGNDRRHRDGIGDSSDSTGARDDPAARERAALAERWAATLSPRLSATEREAARRERGLPELASLETAIEQLLVGPMFDRLTANGRQRVERVLPLALACLPDGDGRADALSRFTGFVRAVAGRSGYLQILIERPEALQRLLRLFASSRWLADFVTQHPIVIDELVAPTVADAPISRDHFVAAVSRERERVRDVELDEQMDAMRRFRQSLTLRIAVAALDGEIPIMQVSDRLSWLAEAVLDVVLTLVRARLVERHGDVRSVAGSGDAATGEPLDIGVVAYGKLGGLELGFGSDLDLVFVSSEHGAESTDGERPIESAQFLARLARHFVNFMSTRTPAGVLYPIDLRLRPNGNSGLLVAGIDAIADYQRHRAWTWEHQALVRARLVVGGTAIRERFDAMRREVLCQPRPRDGLRDEVVNMRRRMREHLAPGAREHFHLKHDSGGTVDIEFVVQYLVLAHAAEHAELVRYTDNIRILAAMVDTGVLSRDRVATLSESYLALRERLHRRALQLQDEQVPLDGALATLRDDVIACWHAVIGDATDALDRSISS